MVTVVGEDPASVVLRWDGPEGGTMFQWDAWYAKLSRLTFDGGGRAETCLRYGPQFSTYNETSDLVLRDAKCGIVFGGPDTAGQAENEVLRCRFLRCGVGIQTVNWNSMDIWVWYCRFEDCGRGIYNVMGNWHAWENLFLRSKISDVSLMNLMAFSVVNNTSVGSKRFLDFSSGHTWGSPTSITGNRVLDPTGDWAMILDNAGPYLVVDNVMRLGKAARGVRMTWADQTLVGNVYSKDNAVEERGRFRRIAEKVVAASDIPDALPTLPPAPPRRQRRVFRPSRDRQCQCGGHPAGDRPWRPDWRASDPWSICRWGPTRSTARWSSPGTATCSLWATGPARSPRGSSGPARPMAYSCAIDGPSRATIRDLQIQAGTSSALLVETPDQPEARIFADQLNTNGPTGQTIGRTAALRVTGFDRARLEFRALQGSGNRGTWVEVVGCGGEAAGQAVGVFTGATGTAAGQYDVRQGGRLVVRGVYHERSSDSLNGLHLTDSGVLSIDATRFSYATSEKSPTVAADNFRGLFTLATCMLMPVETQETCRFELRGDGSRTSVLALNDQFWVQKPGTSADTVWLNRASRRPRAD